MTVLLEMIPEALQDLFGKRGGGITEMAEGVSKSLRSYMSERRITGAELASDSYRRIMERLEQLEQRVQADWEADGRDTTDGVWWWLKKLRTFGGAALSFESRVRNLRRHLDNTLADIREKIESQAEPRLPVPDQLDKTSELWRQASVRVEEVNKQVLTLGKVMGWGGAASSTYGNMVEVQIEASKEFQHLPRVMSDSYAMYRDLNKAVLCAAERALRFAMVQADQVDAALDDPLVRLLRGMYPLSNNWRAILDDLSAELDSVFSVSDSGSNSVGSQLDSVRSSLTVTQKGWPSGLGMAGTRAGNTSTHISAHASTESARARYRVPKFGLN